MPPKKRQPILKREPKKVNFTQVICECCGETFESYPIQDMEFPQNIASDGRNWTPSGPYFIKVNGLTALQYGKLCPDCTEKVLAERVRTNPHNPTDIYSEDT